MSGRISQRVAVGKFRAKKLGVRKVMLRPKYLTKVVFALDPAAADTSSSYSDPVDIDGSDSKKHRRVFEDMNMPMPMDLDEDESKKVNFEPFDPMELDSPPEEDAATVSAVDDDVAVVSTVDEEVATDSIDDEEAATDSIVDDEVAKAESVDKPPVARIRRTITHITEVVVYK
jgi:hypothetical protein